MRAFPNRLVFALATALVVGVSLPMTRHPEPTPVAAVEGRGFWERLGCVGCIGVLVGGAVELSPFAVLLAAGSNVTYTAGCAFICSIATL